MSGGVLAATTTTALARATVHQQYNGRAFGVRMLNNLIPIVLHIRQPGGGFSNSILVFDKLAHRHVPYKDYGIRKKCCRRVLLFNVNHYYKCYLPTHIGADGEVQTPYTFNRCEKCNVQLKDACGHLVSVTTMRQYNVDKFIYRAPAVLQSSGKNELFKYQKGNC